MACYKPLKGWLSKDLTASGKRKMVFKIDQAYTDLLLAIPCGRCVGCRLDRSKQWAVRCVHEAQLYDNNSFITLTYNDEHLPEDGSLEVRVFQLFMKRLRKRFGSKIRFYACGEYGDKYGRPHYHACLFNHDFQDKKVWKPGKDPSQNLYRSAELEKLWPYGYSSIGEVTFQSAAYVARYIMKKLTGPKGGSHYTFINEVTGVVTSRLPEFTVMSRRPGIGKNWLEKYATDVYPDDFVIMRDGKKHRTPRYYDTEYEKEFPSDIRKIKLKRKQKSIAHGKDNTSSRLQVREFIQLKKLDQLERNHDSDS